MLSTFYTADILYKLSLKRKWKHQKQAIKVGNIASFTQNLPGRNEYLEVAVLNLFLFVASLFGSKVAGNKIISKSR